MKYAIVSDLHANRLAWNTVLADIRAQCVDTIICLGDVVGYGPCPAEVLSSVHETVQHSVLGNHDAAVAGEIDTSRFSKDAQASIDWTRERLDDKAVEWLKSLPHVIRGDGFRCTHATADHPRAFFYMDGEEAVRASLDVMDEPLLFVGHTHDPAIYYLTEDDQFWALEAGDFRIAKGKRYVVNVGSVGVSRDGDFRACYCIYDDAGKVSFRRVAYDLDAFRNELDETGCPAGQMHRLLDRYDKTALEPVRERVDFRPLSNDKVPRTVTELDVKRSTPTRSNSRIWMMAAVLALLTILVILGATTCESAEPEAEEEVIEARPGRQLELKEDALSLLSLPGSIGHRVPSGWACRLVRSDQQKLRLESDGKLIVEHLSPHVIEFTLSQVTVSRCRKIQVIVEGECPELPILDLDYICTDGTVRSCADTKRAVRVGTTGFRIQRTPRPLARSVQRVRFRFRVRFAGRLVVKSFQLRQRESRSNSRLSSGTRNVPAVGR